MTHLEQALIWRGITPPPYGSNRTICPQCSKTRKKAHDRCLSVFATDGWVEWICRHCGWTDGETI